MITIKGKTGVQMSVSKVKCHLSTSTDSHQGVGGLWVSFLLIVYVDSSFDTRSRLFVAFCSLYVNICFLSKKLTQTAVSALVFPRGLLLYTVGPQPLRVKNRPVPKFKAKTLVEAPDGIHGLAYS